MSVILFFRRRRFALLEHLEHAVGDDETAKNVGRSKNHGDEAERMKQRRVGRTGYQKRSQDHYAVDGVGARHQGRVQHRRHAAYHLEADEDRHDEDVNAQHQFRTHFVDPAICVETGDMPSSNRVGLCRTSASATMQTASMMSSPTLRLSWPLGARSVTSAARFLA